MPCLPAWRHLSAPATSGCFWILLDPSSLRLYKPADGSLCNIDTNYPSTPLNTALTLDTVLPYIWFSCRDRHNGHTNLTSP